MSFLNKKTGAVSAVVIAGLLLFEGVRYADQWLDANHSLTDAADTEALAEESNSETIETIIPADAPDTELSGLEGTECEPEESTNSSQLAEVYTAAVEIDSQISSDHPALASALEQENKTHQQAMEQTIAEFAVSAGSDDQQLTYTENVSIRRSDNYVCSLLYDGYISGIDDYPTYYRKGINFNTQTGTKIALSDVISDRTSFITAVQDQLNLYWPHLDTLMTPEEYFNSTSDEDLSWVLDYNGITLYFNPETLASYSAGLQTVTLTFADYPDLFTDTYQNCPEEYQVTLTPEDSFYTDIDGDGSTDELIVIGLAADDDMYEGVGYYLNGKYSETKFHTPVYELQFVYLSTSEESTLHLNIDDGNYITIDLKEAMAEQTAQTEQTEQSSQQ